MNSNSTTPASGSPVPRTDTTPPGEYPAWSVPLVNRMDRMERELDQVTKALAKTAETVKNLEETEEMNRRLTWLKVVAYVSGAITAVGALLIFLFTHF